MIIAFKCNPSLTYYLSYYMTATKSTHISKYIFTTLKLRVAYSVF
mgnify:FL=1